MMRKTVSGKKQGKTGSIEKKRGREKNRNNELQELREYNNILEKVNRGLKSFIAEMTIVFRFIETVGGVHSLERILELLLGVLKDLCGYDAAVLSLAAAVEPESRPELKRELLPEVVERFRKHLAIDERIYKWVYCQGQAVIIPDRFSSQRTHEFKGWSYMIAPLATSAERLGRIELVFQRPQGTFTQQTFSILNVLLKHAAVIIANERIYEKESQTVRRYIELDMLKKDIVRTTTHEIKTPLTIIHASSILLEKSARMSRAERRELLENNVRQCERIDQIITELFESAQLDEGQPALRREAVSLTTLTGEVIAGIPFDSARIVFVKRFPSNLGRVWADRAGIYKVLRNLIENAVKYSPQGGRIRIQARNQGSKVICEIKDQGVGISQADQTEIFKKFFRAGDSSTRSVRGMGFGLYIVKNNVELNNGRISVQSRLGRGTAFILELPKVEKNRNSKTAVD